ncbi:MAG: tetratricopeptide repeat protein [Actinomycetes bacterium]
MSKRERIEEEKRFLFESLADLEREHAAGDVDEHDYVALKDSYTARAARFIAEHDATSDEKSRTRRPRNIVWAVSVLVLAVVSGVLVANNSGERRTGQVMTGTVDDGSVSSLLVQARSMGMSDIPAVLDLYSRVLAIEPDNIEALTYFGWYSVLSATQESDQARAAERLESGLVLMRQATIADSTYPDAHCFLGITFFRFLDDPQAAEPEIDACLESNPPAEVATLVEGLADQVDEAITGTTTVAP